MFKVWIQLSSIFVVLATVRCDSCFVFDTDFASSNVNDGLSTMVNSAGECQSLCQSSSACNYWSWVGPEYTVNYNYVRSCWLKSDAPELVPSKGVVSGPKICDSASECCEEILLDTSGMGDFYQGQRLGYYKKYLDTASGRFVYQQVGGDQFMYYLESQGIWMVGETVGQDLGGILNRGDSQCPEDLTPEWEYWSTGFEEWDNDWGMAATCQNGGPTQPPNAESCSYGTICESCAITHEQDGILYCCSVGCDYGWIDVGMQNGNVVCSCGH
ncbi:hypothetical protein TCAL_06582 [Tigriopus californicus]|uniref:Apple domain-containing protein n=1 Tax=Tigriopus californicus TaxID=6832 RepID=A0A553PPS3_TIGCA|nr:uncharacterized protein LOC131882537 [Tigriopus californicus]TRY79651.1 hypothetical protein TCAL_06582 [Tigriopus californicus]|eukprot:TCALIF_06582-PA protein Name:"Protein of unknown function" AED:0.00 eAED:0.00 QI:29/1/1/1/0.75/1/5/51/270